MLRLVFHRQAHDARAAPAAVETQIRRPPGLPRNPNFLRLDGAALAFASARTGLERFAMSDPWYNDGLRFTCTRCGHCCTGEPGFV